MRVSEIPGIYGMSLDEKIQLVEDLWDSIAAEYEAAPLTDDQKAELDRRVAEYEADKNPGRPAEDVLRDIENKLKP